MSSPPSSNQTSTPTLPSSVIPPCASLISTSQSSFDIRKFEDAYYADSESVSSILGSAGLDTLDDWRQKGVNYPKRGSVVAGKEALNVQSTGANFRRFVQRSGPIFLLQDHLLIILAWESPRQSLLFSIAWALLCRFPRLALLLPHLILISSLLHNVPPSLQPPPPPKTPSLDLPDYAEGEGEEEGGKEGDEPKEEGAVEEEEDSNDGGEAVSATGRVMKPPGEGSIDYLANLQNIQNLMGVFSAFLDLIAQSVLPHLLWSVPISSPSTSPSNPSPPPTSNTTTSHHLLFFLLITFPPLATLVFLDLIPIKTVILFIGEAVIFSGHPLVKVWLKKVKEKGAIERLGKEVERRWNWWRGEVEKTEEKGIVIGEVGSESREEGGYL